MGAGLWTVEAAWDTQRAARGLGEGDSDEAFEAAADRLAEKLFSRAAALLQEEDGNAALGALSQREGGVNRGFGPFSGRFGFRPAVANYLDALSQQKSGLERELGLCALARSKGFEGAGEWLVERLFEKAKEAMFEEGRHRPDRMAKEICRNEGIWSWMGKAARGAMNFGELVDCWLSFTVKEWAIGKEERARLAARAALGELLDAAQRRPDIINGPEQTPGWLLMRIASFERDRVGGRGQELHAWLSGRARDWIEKGMHTPEPGELAASLCYGMSLALDYRTEAALMETVSTLKAALAKGHGARRAWGDQPLKMLLGFGGLGTEGWEAPRALVDQAAQALIEAGADESDVVDRVESALKGAPNQGLARKLMAMREGREIAKGLGEMSAEEAEAVAEFLRLRRERAGLKAGEAAQRAPARRSAL